MEMIFYIQMNNQLLVVKCGWNCGWSFVILHVGSLSAYDLLFLSINIDMSRLYAVKWLFSVKMCECVCKIEEIE